MGRAGRARAREEKDKWKAKNVGEKKEDDAAMYNAFPLS
jgi:hypothetical protein